MAGWRVLPAADNPVHQTAEKWIGQQREDRCNYQGLARIEFAKNEELVDQINDDSDEEDFAQVPPAFLQ